MRARLIFNPTATTTNAGVRDALAALLADEVELSVVGTRARLHAADLARQAVADEVDAVFVLGGDGTANEALQGLAGTDVALGLLPGGGTNVLARALGLPRGAADAAAEPLERMKTVLGQLAFILLGLREWATSTDRREPACRPMDVQGIDAEPRMLVSVANLDPYTYLGPRPFRLLPGAGAGTALDVFTARPMPTGRVLRVIERAFRDSSHVEDEGIDLVHDVDRVHVEADRPMPLMVDGDLVDHVRRATFRHRPGLVRVLAELHGEEAAGGDVRGRVA